MYTLSVVTSNIRLITQRHSTLKCLTQFFSALHGMPARTSDEKMSLRPSVCLSVRLSVRPSVKRVHCDKKEERSVQIFVPCERSFSLVFREEEWLVGRPLLPEILGQPAPVGTKSSILNRYSLIAPQP